MPAPPLGSEPAMVRATGRIRSQDTLLEPERECGSGERPHGEFHLCFTGRHEACRHAGIDLENPDLTRRRADVENLGIHAGNAKRHWQPRLRQWFGSRAACEIGSIAETLASGGEDDYRTARCGVVG